MSQAVDTLTHIRVVIESMRLCGHYSKGRLVLESYIRAGISLRKVLDLVYEEQESVGVLSKVAAERLEWAKDSALDCVELLAGITQSYAAKQTSSIPIHLRSFEDGFNECLNELVRCETYLTAAENAGEEVDLDRLIEQQEKEEAQKQSPLRTPLRDDEGGNLSSGPPPPPVGGYTLHDPYLQQYMQQYLQSFPKRQVPPDLDPRIIEEDLGDFPEVKQEAWKEKKRLAKLFGRENDSGEE